LRETPGGIRGVILFCRGGIKSFRGKSTGKGGGKMVSLKGTSKKS